MRKNIRRSVVFFVLLVLGFAVTVKILRFKNVDGVYMMQSFYDQEKNTVDVLILGTSHAFEHFNSGVLWQEHGIASYDLGGPNQRLWNTYYFLKEALKTQSPELIILEGFAVCCTDDYLTDGQIVSNTYGMKWSEDKLNALKETVPEERMGEFLPEYVRYHSRYKDISKEDFIKDKGDPYYDNWKGFFCNFQKGGIEADDVSDVTGVRALEPKTQFYYEKILQLAQNENIPLFVVITPYPNVSDDHMMAFHTAELLAEQYGANFLNCNQNVTHYGIDFTADGADAEHLNYLGNQKFTRVFGNDLMEMYDLPDHRGDPAYESWQRNADYLQEMIENQELSEATEKDAILSKLDNENYWVFVAVNGNCTTADPELSDYMETLGIEKDGARGVWLRDNGKETVMPVGEGTYECYYRHKRNDLCVVRDMGEDLVYWDKIVVNHQDYQGISNGMSIVVYDTMTEKVADFFDINASDGYQIVRRE